MRLSLDFKVLRDKHPADDQSESEVVQDDYVVGSHQRVHKDLYKQLRLLNMHLALITEYIDEDALDPNAFNHIAKGKLKEHNPELFEVYKKFIVTQVIFTGEGPQAGVILVGMRELKSGHVINLTGRNIVLESTGGNNPRFLGHLDQTVKTLEKEAQFYLGGKCAWDEGQLDLFKQPVEEVAK